MPSELRIGVIGCSDRALRICQGIAEAPNASIAMLMDPRPELLSSMAEVLSARTTTDIDEVLASDDVNAVYVAVPADERASIGIRAAAAGKHVLVEAPMATLLGDADALMAACREHGVVLGVAHRAPVDGGMAAARDLVRGGALGAIMAVRITAYANGPEGDTGRSSAGGVGGILMGCVIDELNTVRWVTGLEVTRVYAEGGTSAAGGAADPVGVVMRYANGAIGVIQAGANTPGGAHDDRPGVRVYGTTGQLILTPNEPLVWLAEPLEGGKRGVWQEVRSSGRQGGAAALVQRFAAAVLAGKEPPSTGLDGRKALEIVRAASCSAERHEAVSLPLGA